MHLEFELAIADVDVEGRTIAGLGVPWNQAGKIGGRTFKFQRGSLAPAMRRTPLQLGHDGEPVGVLAEHVDDDDGARVTFRVDRTPDGDRALVQAASGSRGALSVGADVDDSTVQADGSVLVTAARYVHFALVPHGAFAGAEVEHVVAHRDKSHDQEGSTVHEDRIAAARETPEPEPEPAPVPEPEPDEPTRARVRVMAERPARDLLAGELVSVIVRAQHGEPDARRYLEAALTESISTDVSGLLPPQYERTVIGGKATLRPLYETFRSRPLPGVGLLVSKPKWTTLPVGAEAASVDADATSTKVVIGSQTATIVRWDWAGAIPWVVVQRSDPSIVDEIYAQAVESFYIYVEGKVYGELSTAVPGVATSLGGALAEFFVGTGNQRSPEVIIMAPDVWGDFADVGALATPTGQGGVDGSALSTSFAGIPAFTSGTLPPGETVLATRRAVDVRVTEPVRLTANAIGALNVELAVVGEGLYDTDYPSELMKFAAITPAVAAAATSTGRSSKSG
jgi:hypothetical protein